MLSSIQAKAFDVECRWMKEKFFHYASNVVLLSRNRNVKYQRENIAEKWSNEIGSDR